MKNLNLNKYKMQQVMHYIFTCLELAKLDKYKLLICTEVQLNVGVILLSPSA